MPHRNHLYRPLLPLPLLPVNHCRHVRPRRVSNQRERYDLQTRHPTADAQRERVQVEVAQMLLCSAQLSRARAVGRGVRAPGAKREAAEREPEGAYRRECRDALDERVL